MDALSLWTGKTVHQRYFPYQRRFSYDIMLIDLDVDRLEEAGRTSRLLRINRPGLFSFRTQDHGPRTKGACLRSWAEKMFASAGIDLEGGQIRLVTFPRHLFFRFAPLSLWYGYDPAGRPAGIIYEVSNTFGEYHCYVAATAQARSRHEAGKSFHVSPFMDVSGTYRFTLRQPDERLSLMVENLSQGQRTHIASITARRVPASSSQLLRLAFTMPLSSLGVAAGIHWQALFIWMRGAAYRRKPDPPPRAATIALGITDPSSANTGHTA